MAAISGKDIMIFVNGEAIALATNHTLNLNSDTNETSSKDSGLWGDEKVTRLRWDASSDSFVDGIGAADSFGVLFGLWKAGEKVSISLAIPSNLDAGVEGGAPAAGWTEPTTGQYEGEALIASVSLNTPHDSDATMSVSLKGVGPLAIAVV